MNAIVTGVSRGIGYQTVLNLAQNGVDRIIGIARSKQALDDLKHELGDQFIPMNYDITLLIADPSPLTDLVSRHFEAVNILVNNAGALHAKPFDQLENSEIANMFAVNYMAPAAIVKCLLPYLIKGQCHTVSISSIGGFQGSVKFNGLSHYSASKAAIASLSECLAEEYKKDGLKFNALAIGAVQTDMLATAFPGYKAPVTPEQMGEFVADFALNGHKMFNGKVLPVSLSTP